MNIVFWMKNPNKALKTIHITLLFRQLATLINAGVPLIQSITLLETSQTNPVVRILLYTIKQELLSGHPLSKALSTHLPMLDRSTCTTIKIGEQTGRLDTLLNQLADTHENQYFFIKQIKQQLFYPAFIAVFAILITIGLFMLVIPQFTELFHDKLQQLPLITRFLFTLSDITVHYGYFILLAFALFIITLTLPIHYFSTLRTTLFNRVKSLPGISPIIRTMTLARFAQQLALLHEAGIALPDALQLLMHDSDQPSFITTLSLARQKIETGMPLHQAIRESSHFPPLMIQLIKIGEETGTLEANLSKIARYLEADIQQSLQQIT